MLKGFKDCRTYDNDAGHKLNNKAIVPCPESFKLLGIPPIRFLDLYRSIHTTRAVHHVKLLTLDTDTQYSLLQSEQLPSHSLLLGSHVCVFHGIVFGRFYLL